MLLKKTFLACTMAAAFGLASSASAGVFIKTPDGITYDVSSIDYPQSSFLADDGITAIQNFDANNGGSTEFNVYTHALVSLFDGVQPAGINSGAYEITLVTSFTEKVTATGTADADFEAIATSGFFQMYIDTTPNANNLAGTGFNDGKLVLSGVLSNAPTGTFNITECATGATENLDQYNGDSWGGQQTVCGFGGNNFLRFGISAYDPTVFLNAPEELLLNFSNISIALPFQEVDPSKCFSPKEGRGDADVGNSFTSSDCTAAGNGIAPDLGTVNGVNGPDFMAQTDFNSSIRASYTPEPGSLALVAGALLAGGMATRRRQKQK